MFTINYTIDNNFLNTIPASYHLALRDELEIEIKKFYPVADILLSTGNLVTEDYRISVSSDILNDFQKEDTAIMVKNIANHVLCFGNWTTEGTVH